MSTRPSALTVAARACPQHQQRLPLLNPKVEPQVQGIPRILLLLLLLPPLLHQQKRKRKRAGAMQQKAPQLEALVELSVVLSLVKRKGKVQ